MAYDNDSTDAPPSDRDEDAEDTDSPGTSVKASSDSNRRDLNSLFDDVSNEVWRFAAVARVVVLVLLPIACIVSGLLLIHAVPCFVI